MQKYYGPDFDLDVRASNMENANSREYLEKIKIQVLENLRQTAHAPSVQSTVIPGATIFGGTEEDDDIEADLDEDENPDVRMTEHRWDKKVTRDDELDESDDEGESHANGLGVSQANGAPKRRNIMDYQNPDAVADDDNDIEMDTTTGTTAATIPQPQELAAIIAAAANAEVNAEIMEEKSRNLKAEDAAEVGPSNAPSRSHSKAPVDTDGDVQMDEPAAEPTAHPQNTPGEEPATTVQAPISPAATIQTSQPAEPAPTEAMAISAPLAESEVKKEVDVPRTPLP